MLPMTTRCLMAYRAEACCPKVADDRPVIIVPDQIGLPGNGAAVTPRSPGGRAQAPPGGPRSPASAPKRHPAIRPGHHQALHHQAAGPGPAGRFVRPAPQTSGNGARCQLQFAASVGAGR